jgi:hypothetical protein
VAAQLVVRQCSSGVDGRHIRFGGADSLAGAFVHAEVHKVDRLALEEEETENNTRQHYGTRHERDLHRGRISMRKVSGICGIATDQAESEVGLLRLGPHASKLPLVVHIDQLQLQEGQRSSMRGWHTSHAAYQHRPRERDQEQSEGMAAQHGVASLDILQRDIPPVICKDDYLVLGWRDLRWRGGGCSGCSSWRLHLELVHS